MEGPIIQVASIRPAAAATAKKPAEISQRFILVFFLCLPGEGNYLIFLLFLYPNVSETVSSVSERRY